MWRRPFARLSPALHPSLAPPFVPSLPFLPSLSRTHDGASRQAAQDLLAGRHPDPRLAKVVLGCVPPAAASPHAAGGRPRPAVLGWPSYRPERRELELTPVAPSRQSRTRARSTTSRSSSGTTQVRPVAPPGRLACCSRPRASRADEPNHLGPPCSPSSRQAATMSSCPTPARISARLWPTRESTSTRRART